MPVYDYYGELLQYVSQTRKHIKQLTFKKPKRVNAFSKRVSLNISLKHFKKNNEKIAFLKFGQAHHSGKTKMTKPLKSFSKSEIM